MKRENILVENYNKFTRGQGIPKLTKEVESEGFGEIYTDDEQAWVNAYDFLTDTSKAFESLDASAPFDADLTELMKQFDDLKDYFEELMENVGVDA
tara:strand:- start:717 stop:1004 length:288 start_codon:yes stop_codon:yes gene_type:complete